MLTAEVKKYIEGKICVVTGGAGFIGSNLVETLLQLNAKKVIVLDDISTGSLDNIEEFNDLPNFQFVAGSITELDTCVNVFNGADIVFQLAALGSVPRSIDNPLKTNEVNVTGFLNVLEAAKKCHVKKVIYSSSSSIYGDDEHLPKQEELTGNPLSPYAVSKRTNELYARVFSDLYDMDIIGLRYFNVYGPKQNINGPYAAVIPIFITNLLNGSPCFINGDGKISRDFTYVQNVVEANICAAANSDNAKDVIFNIAMGNQLSLNELYENIEAHIQSGLDPIHRDKRVGDISSSLADIKKAIEQISYKPKYEFSEGIKKTIDWYKNQK
ncbi:NAD-dependent epimerase/dehydratase family protein [Paracrocinitomix mangrovi]|uniref:NAD-dependent epimerase/dehydratase family protein n=1 Tax=Paracrocinitomix mangrovi TaxID=2862509 RepID=UPI001C8D8D53|nr:NAD-dependent epimerase/dehydratase family protein [Paracrocinitomix mangrovi]UKN02774.1 NAD-dependent epimerase/dehydratase family protein [Paracrocinitomix mangrovi]